MKATIKRLVETASPPGYESTIRDVIKDEIKPLKGEVDALGNLIVRIGAKTKDGLRVMLAAHMDEIGVMISHIDENGFARFSPLGGVRPNTCFGGRVLFINGAHGVINGEVIESTDKVIPFDKLFIDTGAKSRKDSPVKVGDVGVFERSFLDLGDRLVSKSMDDRIGCAVLIEAMRQIKKTPHELVCVFSTQEEVGLRGATGAAYSIDPDLGISLDVTAWGDTPKSIKMAVALGKGPAIKVRDGGMIADPRVVDLMVESARKSGIPYQMEILEMGTTDARMMQVTRAGVPAGCISIPCRYVHSPSEMVDYTDVQNAVKLLVAILSKPIHLPES